MRSETMRSSTEEALRLLNKWRDEETWVLVIGHFENRVEQHMFWAKCLEVSAAEVLLSGDFVVMRVPLDSAEFEFADVREAPEPMKSSYANFESVLNIIKKSEFAIALMPSLTGSPVPILPPDVINPEGR
jgi:hypothetical protein